MNAAGLEETPRLPVVTEAGTSGLKFVVRDLLVGDLVTFTYVEAPFVIEPSTFEVCLVVRWVFIVSGNSLVTVMAGTVMS